MKDPLKITFELPVKGRFNLWTLDDTFWEEKGVGEQGLDRIWDDVILANSL